MYAISVPPSLAAPVQFLPYFKCINIDLREMLSRTSEILRLKLGGL